MKRILLFVLLGCALVAWGCSSDTAGRCIDDDGDGYGEGSDCTGADCDDTDPSCHEGACCAGCVDEDGDGYGVGDACTGPDCDDAVASCHTDCTSDNCAVATTDLVADCRACRPTDRAPNGGIHRRAVSARIDDYQGAYQNAVFYHHGEFLVLL